MKKPRFFCDNCGAEVGRHEKSCPKCGRFFASVRCPACGFSGEEALFTGGCPACGYSAPGPAKKRGWSRGDQNNGRIAAGALPVWVYLFSILALICVFGILFIVIRS
jgi:predicted RNA-binding Zn-ribbon protein involved in translation (DUF1610 family)